MKSLITGVDGFIGSHLAHYLKSQGHQIIGLSHLPNYISPDVDKVIRIDLANSDVASIKAQLDGDIDYVYHLAGLASIPFSLENPYEDFKVNAGGTLLMLESVKHLHLKAFVLSSSVSVLSTNNTTCIHEALPYYPQSPYSAAKMAAEGYCLAFFAHYDVPIKICRLFNVFGPKRIGLVVYDIISKIIKSPKQIEVFGDGNQIRDFIFVKDAIRYLQLIADNGTNGEIYNVGSGQPITINKLIKHVIKILDLKDCDIKYNIHKTTSENKNWYADMSKTNKLGYIDLVTFDDALSETINWIHNNIEK